MGKAIANPYWENTCPVCSKQFFVNWPEHWVYKRNINHAEKFFCTWRCLRDYDRKGKEKMVKAGKKRIISQELEAQAVDLAIDGGDPVQFLKEHGSTDPQRMWYRIRARLKAEDPEAYEKLPKRIYRTVKAEEPEIPKTAGDAMALCAETADKFFDDLKAMGILNAETPEQPKITKPLNYDGMTVREVEGSFARYRRSDVSGSTYIDVEVHEGCDTLSYTVEQWRSFRKEHEKAAAILGVEL